MDANIIQTILVYAIPVLFSITVHEAAHGYIARRLGDDTAYVLGRVTLNPLKHIDPIGTILMPIMLAVATKGAFVFGYAKPVPVNFGRLRNPRRDSILVALAGPASNFFQAILWAVLFMLLQLTGVTEPFFLGMARAGVLVNLVMWAFNLFPLPPLDGGRVLSNLLPYGPAQALARIEPFGFFIVMGLVLMGVIATFWMRPLMTAGYAVINVIVLPLTWLR